MIGDDNMKKQRLKKIADQEQNFPYGILFRDSPFEKIDNDKAVKTMFGPSVRIDWRFMDFQNTNNPEWQHQMSNSSISRK
jgi:hypothetical protein